MRDLLRQRGPRFWSVACLFGMFSMVGPTAWGAVPAPVNLALQACGAHARSWQPGVRVIPQREPIEIPARGHSSRRDAPLHG